MSHYSLVLFISFMNCNGKQGFYLIHALIFTLLSGCQSVHKEAQTEIEIFHTNDMHSHFAGSRQNNACLKEKDCSGGYGAIREYVLKAKRQNPDLLFLDAGDKFQGSLLYVNYKSPFVSKIDNQMHYDAGTFGNHEFDEGCQKLEEFYHNANYPLIAANLKPEDGCPLKKANIAPYVIRDYKNTKIGLIGLANPDVVAESGACKYTKFEDPIKATKDAVEQLKSKDVKIIILLSHLGLPFDQKLAKTINGLDIIVGGHTHDYIGPGSKIGGYPIVEKAPDGQPVLIVTTAGQANYLGHLKTSFNSEGVPVKWSGNPITVGKSGGNAKITEVIDAAADKLIAKKSETIGENRIRANDGLDACREGDCLSASLITQAMLEHSRSKGAEIALINGGSFRGALPFGKITAGDPDNIQPFKDVLEIRRYTGKQLSEAVEHGVSDVDGIGPRILQPANLRYSYNPKAPVGKRVISIEIKNKKGVWKPLNPSKKYVVATNTFLSGGGDRHIALGSGELVSKTHESIPDIFRKWISAHTPLTRNPEPRIRAVHQ